MGVSFLPWVRLWRSGAGLRGLRRAGHIEARVPGILSGLAAGPERYRQRPGCPARFPSARGNPDCRPIPWTILARGAGRSHQCWTSLRGAAAWKATAGSRSRVLAVTSPWRILAPHPRRHFGAARGARKVVPAV